MRFQTKTDAGVVQLIDTETGTEAEIYLFGGLLNAFTIELKSGRQNLVAGFSGVADAEQHITNGFKSAKLSPFVCRLNKGRYRFAGQDYQVTKHFLHVHAIHGLVYDGLYTITAQKGDDNEASVTLQYTYNATDAGYPFAYTLVITWSLRSGNRLQVTTAVHHQNASAIPLADGWHPYFTLGGPVNDLTLAFSPADQLEYDAELIPTGNKTEGHRFSEGLLLKDVALDNGFLWKDLSRTNRCTIRNQVLELAVIPDNSYPVLQLYIPPHRNSIAIENLSGAPDNFNNGIGLVLLQPGETKYFSTTYVATAL